MDWARRMGVRLLTLLLSLLPTPHPHLAPFPLSLPLWRPLPRRSRFCHMRMLLGAALGRSKRMAARRGNNPGPSPVMPKRPRPQAIGNVNEASKCLINNLE